MKTEHTGSELLYDAGLEAQGYMPQSGLSLSDDLKLTTWAGGDAEHSVQLCLTPAQALDLVLRLIATSQHVLQLNEKANC